MMPVLSLSTLIQSGLAFTVLAVLIVVAFFVVSSFRDYVAGDQETASDALSNLREIHRRGDITDEEFRTIQARTQQPRSGTSTTEFESDASSDANVSAPPNSTIDKV